MQQKRCSKAFVRICGCDEHPKLHGTVRFFQRNDGVIVEVEMHGLPETETSFFAFHIHEGDNCEGVGFPNTGSHFNSGATMHPQHAGDLPPLLAGHGKAYMKVFTDRFCVEEIIGKTVIIVDQQNHTDPSSHSIIIHIQERLAFLLRRAYVRSTFLTVGLRSALYSEES
jgi:Cu-Zn family superoxide dismutase